MIDGLYSRAIDEVGNAIRCREPAVVIESRAGDDASEARNTIERVRDYFGTGAPIKIIHRPRSPQSPLMAQVELKRRIKEEIENDDRDYVRLLLRPGDRINTLRDGRLVETYICETAQQAMAQIEIDTPVVDIPKPRPGAPVLDQLKFWAATRRGTLPSPLLRSFFLGNQNPPIDEYAPTEKDESLPPRFASGASLPQNELVLVSYWRSPWKLPTLVDATLGWVDDSYPSPNGNADYSNGAHILLATLFPGEMSDFRNRGQPPYYNVGWQDPAYLRYMPYPGTNMRIHRIPRP